MGIVCRKLPLIFRLFRVVKAPRGLVMKGRIRSELCLRDHEMSDMMKYVDFFIDFTLCVENVNGNSAPSLDINYT